jgi:hypothetical protein
MDHAFLKANSQIPSLGNISFSDVNMETKIYCFALIILWAMLMFSLLIYQFNTFTMVKNGIGNSNGGEMV